MAREISPVSDFIFGSIMTGLLMDTVNVELTVRMVKGIYMHRKDHMAKSTVFSPWSRTIIPFSSLRRKLQAYQDKNNQMSAWNKGHAVPYHPTQPQPKDRCTSGKTRTRWSNQRSRFNPIKTECYNMQNREMMDFRKVDLIIQPLNNYAPEHMTSTHIASLMAHMPQQPHWTGLVRTGKAIRPRQGNNAPSLTSTF